MRGGANGSGPSVGNRNALKRAAIVIPIIQEIQGAGIASMAGIAEALNNRGVASPRERSWGPSQVWRVLRRAST